MGISRQQVAAALNDVRLSGRAWPPTAPEFREMCILSGTERVPPLEVLYTELNQFVRSGKSSVAGASKYLYHLVVRNLDYYNYRNATIDENLKMFTVAYKAMIFQLESGEELLIEPPPETLLPKPEFRQPSEEEKKKGSEAIANLLDMFESTQKPPLTPAEIEDLKRAERIRKEV